MDSLRQEGAALGFTTFDYTTSVAQPGQGRDDDDGDDAAQREDVECQPEVEQRHHGHEYDEDRGVQHRAEKLPGEEASDAPHLPHAMERHTCRRGLEEVCGQAQHALEHVGAELDVDPRGEADQQVAAQRREGCLEADHHDHDGAQDPEGAEGVVAEHAITHQAPEHDRRQCQHRQHDRRDGDVCDDALLVRDHRYDQADAEGLLLVRELVVPLGQDHLARPGVLEGLPVERQQPTRPGRSGPAGPRVRRRRPPRSAGAGNRIRRSGARWPAGPGPGARCRPSAATRRGIPNRRPNHSARPAGSLPRYLRI